MWVFILLSAGFRKETGRKRIIGRAPFPSTENVFFCIPAAQAGGPRLTFLLREALFMLLLPVSF